MLNAKYFKTTSASQVKTGGGLLTQQEGNTAKAFLHTARREEMRGGKERRGGEKRPGEETRGEERRGEEVRIGKKVRRGAPKL